MSTQIKIDEHPEFDAFQYLDTEDPIRPMKTCIFTGHRFKAADGEHVLQNFLGARWVSRDISCNEVQAKFGQTIDCHLEERLRPFRNLLGTKGGRGEMGPDLKNIMDTSGHKHHIRPGGVSHLAEPVVVSRQRDAESHFVYAKIGDKKQLGWLTAKLRERFPNANISQEEIAQHLVSESTYLSEMIHLEPKIGGRDYFRGVLKSVFNLLGANNSEIALQPCFDRLRAYVVDGIGDDTSHVRWLAAADKLAIPQAGRFDHFIAVYSNGTRVDGIVQFFGSICHLLRFTDDYRGGNFCYGYLVDPLRNSEPAEFRNPRFNADLLPKFDAHFMKPGPEVSAVYEELTSRFLASYVDHATQSEVSRIVSNVLGAPDGKELTEKSLEELAQQIAKFIER